MFRSSSVSMSASLRGNYLVYVSKYKAADLIADAVYWETENVQVSDSPAELLAWLDSGDCLSTGARTFTREQFYNLALSVLTYSERAQRPLLVAKDMIDAVRFMCREDEQRIHEQQATVEMLIKEAKEKVGG